MQPSAPAPAQTSSKRDAVPRGERLVQAVGAAVRVAVQLRLDARPSPRARAGNGGNGPSFEASLTTRSRPSSRWTSSTGFPGWYGVRPRPRGGRAACAIASDSTAASPSGSTSTKRPSARAVVAAAEPFALVAELLVERDRRLVVREDVQLELRHAAPCAPTPRPRASARCRPRGGGARRRPSGRGRRRGRSPGAGRA